jgi:hypothetical protein
MLAKFNMTLSRIRQGQLGNKSSSLELSGLVLIFLLKGGAGYE